MVKAVERTVKKWTDRVAVAAPDYEAGVKAPTKDWADRATAAETRWSTEIAKAATEKRFSAGVKTVGTSGWQEKTIAKGVPRWPEGVRIGRADYEDAIRNVLAFEDPLQKKILAMPDATLDQRIARMTAWVKGMAAFKKKG